MRIINLEKKIGSFRLEVEKLQFDEGKIYGLMGSNGSGKTVFLKTIMGILPLDKGYIDYQGLKQRDITMMPQRPYFLHQSVYENLIYPLKIRKIKPDEEEINRLLALLKLDDMKDAYARSLSSGQRQKLSFLRGIVAKPKLILMDETMSNLDKESVNTIRDLILDIQKRQPATWIIVHHQMEQSDGFCDKYFNMEGGKVIG